YEGQAATGHIHRLGEQLAYRLQDTINTLTPSMQVAHIEPFVFDWHTANIATQAKSLANKTNTQYVMFVVIEDISIDEQKKKTFSLHKSDPYLRAFNFSLHLVNGATGETLYTNQYQSTAPWQHDITETVDVGSLDFWRGTYGQNIERMLQTSTLDLEEFAMCQPTMGRVLAVADNQLQINLGRTHQVQAGDQLTLFKVKQLSDPFGQEYRQFILHPTTLVVRQVYSNTATLAALDNSLLGDVQPNDYVARQ
ncbi:MAG: flagella assembly protein FlgT middle domain-containing protein, partial [Pseudomonadota bacterium]